jgi:hypothetical protein
LRLVNARAFLQVVKAKDLHTNTYVAIKIIRCERRFIDQAQCEQHLLNVINAHSAGNYHQDYIGEEHDAENVFYNGRFCSSPVE